jgi:microcin C transport system substrate-binding protein
MRHARLLTALLALAAGPLLLAPAPARADSPVRVVHAIAMVGEPKFGPDFKHFGFVNPDAPKGGDLHMAAIGSFDNFNPFIVKGNSAANVGALFETLTTPDPDEPFTEYGLLAKSIEVPDDRSWVAFDLRPEARFQDGTPVTAEDVVFSFETLRDKGDPRYALYYASVTKAEVLGPLKVKFTFKDAHNRELPLIMGELPVLPKHYWQGKSFDETTLTPPIGSGAYKVESFEVGRYVTYRRDPNYWGWKLPVKVGRDNFDVMRFDYYKDPNVAQIAFLAGAYDFKIESSSKTWSTGYNTPAVKDGRVVKAAIKNANPSGMQSFAFNIRKPMFQDRKLREALDYAFDFEWSNKALFFGLYTRTKSYFDNSELASRGLPSPEELKILDPFRGKIPDEVFTKEYTLPTTDGSGNNRANLRKAAALLESAGWVIKDGKLVNKATGQPLSFEILLDSPLFERVALPFSQNLKRLGVEARVRTVDPAQYQQRLQNFDYDVIVGLWGESPSPGNEQREFWGSRAADIPGSQNLIGIKDPVVDALIDEVVGAPDRDQLVTRVHALDRVLLWGQYVIPHWHSQVFRVVYWDRFGRPTTAPKYDLGFDSWWIDQSKDATLKQRGRS